MGYILFTWDTAPNGGKVADGATVSSTARRYSLDTLPWRSFGIISNATFNAYVQPKHSGLWLVISSFQDFSSCSYICIKVHLVEFEFIGQEPPDAAPIEGVFAVGHDHGLFIETLSHSLHDSLECFQESLLGHTLLSLIFLIKTRFNDRFDNVAYYLKQ